ncbi:iron chaperone [Cellulomonas rhizosphaerae]|uniref:DUF1801 domain-containing protein n=1 Tax=Cellulomonas rhizosphaerae TaxID=2293719 RepID=A0A413RLC3_9CELL|nr:DUF1801 domain-containing protein [Cellulomonas rhizosphaerae]RHA40729.1 DUF1801 domain-containing protein [Cellulomonas rhizosphaerae]
MTTTKSSTKTGAAFTDEERAAMKERAAEAKAARTASGKKADGDAEVRAKIAELPDEDRELADRVHALITEAAPDLTPRTWYGMPAYAKDGKVVVFFQPASKFKARYSTLGFNDTANLDDGSMWPSAYALTKLTASDEKKLVALVKQSVS